MRFERTNTFFNIYLTNLIMRSSSAPIGNSSKKLGAHFDLHYLEEKLMISPLKKLMLNYFELPIFNYIGQLSHIIMGSIGYIAGIVAVIGTFTNVPIIKMKIPVYIMFSAWTFNFFYGIFVVPILGLGG